MTEKQWISRYEEVLKEIAFKIESIIDRLSEKFMIYQYKNKEIDYRNDNWDLFFWCNCGDMSYVTLSPHHKENIERHEEIMITIDSVLNFLKTISVEGVEVVIQYTVLYNTVVNKMVVKYCEDEQGKFINYGGYTGKIVKMGDTFFFKKKGAKKKMYYINNFIILRNILAV